MSERHRDGVLAREAWLLTGTFADIEAKVSAGVTLDTADRDVILQALADRDRLDRLESWLQSPADKDHCVEAWRNNDDSSIWLYAMTHIPTSYGPETISEAPTLRAAIDGLPMKP